MLGRFLKINFILLIMHTASLMFKNVESVRVCKKFSDYFIKNSKNCWDNSDSELNVVSKNG